MLEKIIIKNINSIDVCEIDFKSGNYKFLNENLFDNLINPVVIYGRNGSGKTAVMNAMS
ncbi:MAG: AAA family ATPase, partial [Firmicutes bacterium]|nr:AAA family ATPase [Candidatus Scatoplasma merdavium]